MTPLQLIWEFPDTAILIGVILACSVVIHLLLRHAITAVTKQMVKQAKARSAKNETPASRALSQARVQQRTATIGSMLRSVVALVVWVVAALTVLGILGVPLTPLLASAGVGGVAVAFGAQSLIKDFLSGIFMMFEDQYGVGDLVDTGEVRGEVEEVGLRITRLRDANGMVWYVRNGEILRVGNVSQGWSTATVDVLIATDQNPQRAIDVLNTVVTEFAADPQWSDILLDPPSVLGVESVSAVQITLRLSLKTAPNHQYAPQRALREASVTALANAGIKSPGIQPDPN